MLPPPLLLRPLPFFAADDVIVDVNGAPSDAATAVVADVVATATHVLAIVAAVAAFASAST